MFVFGGQFRSSLSEGALLEDNPVCNRASSRTPGCLDHLLQLATSKTSRCSGGVTNRTTELWGIESVQNGKQKDEPGLQMQAGISFLCPQGQLQDSQRIQSLLVKREGWVLVDLHREGV